MQTLAVSGKMPICRFKLSSCVEQLRAMGFTYESAAEAALATAGNVSLAADNLTSGGRSSLDCEALMW